jgi:hypothetical protein
MEKALQIFNFQNQRVRTIILNGEIWFVIADGGIGARDWECQHGDFSS